MMVNYLFPNTLAAEQYIALAVESSREKKSYTYNTIYDSYYIGIGITARRVVVVQSYCCGSEIGVLNPT